MIRLPLAALAIAASIAASIAAGARAEVRTAPLEHSRDGITFKGVVAWDDASDAKRPGVLVVHEWWGCNDYAQRRARELAALGYVAFACDLYGDGRSTSDRAEAAKWAGEVYADPELARRRGADALAALSGFRLTDPTKLAAIGFCFGGSMVLELARSGADLDAVASFHGGLGSGRPAEPGAIKAEVLVLNGAEDPMVAAGDRAAFMDEMRKAKATWTFVEFGGAVHAFSNPAAGKPTGGAAAHDPRAEQQSWSMLRELLARTLS